MRVNSFQASKEVVAVTQTWSDQSQVNDTDGAKREESLDWKVVLDEKEMGYDN